MRVKPRYEPEPEDSETVAAADWWRIARQILTDGEDAGAQEALESGHDASPPRNCIPAPSAMKDTNPKDAAADGKVPLALLSPIAKAHWAMAQFAGMSKYGAWNWRTAGVRASVYLHAMSRHIDAFLSGEALDPVDGTHHLGNVMACCAILLDASAAGKLTDDRPPSVDIRETYAELEALARRLRDQYAHLEPRHYTIADTEGRGGHGQ